MERIKIVSFRIKKDSAKIPEKIKDLHQLKELDRATAKRKSSSEKRNKSSSYAHETSVLNET